MKTIIFTAIMRTIMIAMMMLFLANVSLSQTDTTDVAKSENPVTQKKDESKSEKKEEKKKNGVFVAYAGASFNHLGTTSTYEPILAPGWILGAAYKHGRFFYWQVGARYNNAVYGLDLAGAGNDTISDNFFSVKDIDIPVTAGLNLLYFTGRSLGLRVYVSAVPAFVLGVGNSDFPNFSKDDVNSFNFYGQGGLGVDVFFLSIDAGYNYGFSDVFANEQSTPGQIYVNLGFRF